MAAGDVYFGSLNLNDGVALKVSGGLPLMSTPIDTLRLALSGREGSARSYNRFTEKTFTVSGSVIGATVAAREANLDTLLKSLSNGLQVLKLGWQDERYFKASLLGGVKYLRPSGTSYFPWDATFLIADAFGWALTPSNVSDASIFTLVSGTTYRRTHTPTVGGTAPSRPVYTVTMPPSGSFPWLTSLYIRNASVSPAQTLTITTTFHASDVIVVDADGLTVKINGALVDYSGTFPVLDPRAGATNTIQIDIIDSVGAPTLTTSIDWTARFLS